MTGATTTNGIRQQHRHDTLSTTGLATLASLSVTGATTTNGITNVGNIGTDTLSTTGRDAGFPQRDGRHHDQRHHQCRQHRHRHAEHDGSGDAGFPQRDGAATTTITGNIGTDTLSTTGLGGIPQSDRQRHHQCRQHRHRHAEHDGSGDAASLNVTGATTTNGITNVGNIGTDTLSTTGLATLASLRRHHDGRHITGVGRHAETDHAERDPRVPQ